MRIMCSIYRYRIVRMCVVFLYKIDIANYWPDMNNTVFLIMFGNPCEQEIVLAVMSSVL